MNPSKSDVGPMVGGRMAFVMEKSMVQLVDAGDGGGDVVVGGDGGGGGGDGVGGGGGGTEGNFGCGDTEMDGIFLTGVC